MYNEEGTPLTFSTCNRITEKRAVSKILSAQNGNSTNRKYNRKISVGDK